MNQWGRAEENTYYYYPISFSESSYGGATSHNISTISNGMVYSVVFFLSDEQNATRCYFKANNDGACRFIIVGK